MNEEEYLLARIQRVLSELGSELGIDVLHRQDVFVLTGDVESEQRRREVEQLVHEHVPDARVRNEIKVTRMTRPAEIEELEPRVPMEGGGR